MPHALEGTPEALEHVRRDFELSGKQTNTRIDALQVWQKQDGGWKLLARQGFKLPA